MRESFVFDKCFYEAIKDLPKDIRGEVYDAVIGYGINGIIQDDLSPLAHTVFTLIKKIIDNNYDRRSETSANNGKLGGRPLKNEQKNNLKKPNQNLNETYLKPNQNLNNELGYLGYSNENDTETNCNTETYEENKQEDEIYYVLGENLKERYPLLDNIYSLPPERKSNVDILINEKEEINKFISSKKNEENFCDFENSNLPTNENLEKEKSCAKKEKEVCLRLENIIPPTVEMIDEYCRTIRNNNIDAQYFYDYYAARDWVFNNKQKMKNWQAAVRTWEKNNINKTYSNGNIQQQANGQLSNRSMHAISQSIRLGNETEFTGTGI